MAEHAITLNQIYNLLLEHTDRFDRIDQRLDRTDERVNGLVQRVDGLESRLDHIDSVQSTMALRLITVETVLNQHSVLLQSLVVRMDSLHGLVEELERRTGRIEQEYVMITEALRRLEKRFDQIEAQRLNERIAALEARLLALETAQP